MDSILTDFIKKSLETFDNQNTNAAELIKGYKGRSVHFTNKQIVFNDEIFDFEILGIYDPNTKVWVWSWALPIIDRKLNYETSQLLKYSLTKDVTNNEIRRKN